MRCSYQYYLRYVLGPSHGYTPRPGAALLWGKMGHKIIQLAYRRVPLAAAHRMVWEELACPVLDELDEWYALDCELRRVKGASNNNSVARLWTAANPRYAELAAVIDEFQAAFLDEWRWEGKHLTKYYRWSQQLSRVRPEDLLLPDPVLVEGEELGEPTGPAASGLSAQGTGGDRMGRWLQGELEGVPVPVVGIPDVIARLGHMFVFADYKFSRIARREDIEQDLQLLLYVELARQRGIILPDQPVVIGHIYPTEKGEVVKVLAGTELHALLLPELRRLFRDMARAVAEGRFHRVRGIDHFSVAPCGMCDLAHLCEPSREAPLIPLDE